MTAEGMQLLGVAARFAGRGGGQVQQPQQVRVAAHEGGGGRQAARHGVGLGGPQVRNLAAHRQPHQPQRHPPGRGRAVGRRQQAQHVAQFELPPSRGTASRRAEAGQPLLGAGVQGFLGRGRAGGGRDGGPGAVRRVRRQHQRGDVAAAVAPAGARRRAQLLFRRRQQLHRRLVGHAVLGHGALRPPARIGPLAPHVLHGFLPQCQPLGRRIQSEAWGQATELHALTCRAAHRTLAPTTKKNTPSSLAHDGKGRRRKLPMRAAGSATAKTRTALGRFGNLVRARSSLKSAQGQTFLAVALLRGAGPPP